jgi:protein-disulfide isomerase
MSDNTKDFLRGDFSLKQMGMALAPLAAIGLLVVGMTPNSAPETAAKAEAPKTEMQVASASATAKEAEQATTATDAKPEKTAPAVPAEAFSKAQRTEIEKIVRAYLVANPEVMVEVSRELERKQQEAQAEAHRKIIVENADKLYRSNLDYVLGNADGDVGVIEFFDYNCGWCKRALDQVQQLVDKDKSVRVVMKEMPIFGEDSTFAAKAAMASKAQGKYWDFHVALMKERRVTQANTLEIAERVGIDVEKLKNDMEDPKIDAALRETSQIAEALQIQGTPGFIVDTKVNVGFVPVEGLQQLVADVRKDGCQTCAK